MEEATETSISHQNSKSNPYHGPGKHHHDGSPPQHQAPEDSSQQHTSSSGGGRSSCSSHDDQDDPRRFSTASYLSSPSEISWEFTIASSKEQGRLGDASSGGSGGGGGGAFGYHSSSHASSSNHGLGQSGEGGRLYSSNSHQHGHRSSRRTRSASKSKRLNEFSIDKLNFSKLGTLYGRDRECQQLQEAWEDVRFFRESTADADAAVVVEEENLNRKPATTSPQHFHHKPSTIRRLVTIQGASGVGKSSVAESIRYRVLRDGGFFLQGKFPQQMNPSSGTGSSITSTEEPYVAFASACHELCDLVATIDDSTSSSPEGGTSIKYEERTLSNVRPHYKFTHKEFRERLERDVGPDARILTRVIPRLSQILARSATTATPTADDENDNGEAPLVDDDKSESIGYLEGHLQFKFAFRRFIRAVTFFGPVVFVLDDLQWADAASVELLEALISDRENGSFLVIACYRDDDMYGHLPHLRSIESIRKMANQDTCLKVDSMTIGNLNVGQVNELLVDLLTSTESETLGLAECVHKKTLGNVFFVVQFLTMLQEANLLAFSFGAMKWRWDVSAIQTSAEATENVVTMMKAKMQNLPMDVREALPNMACLGSSFSFTLFLIVVEHFSNSSLEDDDDYNGDECREPDTIHDIPSSQRSRAILLLKQCETEGLIEISGEDEDGVECYQWVHDKIQEAAFSLIDEDKLTALKLEIGKALYEHLQGPDLEKHLFIVANLLSSPSKDNPISLPSQKPIEVAKLFLRAGVKTIENSAFEQASFYLLKGIELLPVSHWQSHCDLSLDLFSTAAEAEFCTGHFDRMRVLCNEVIRQDRISLIDKKRVYNVMIDSTGAEERLSDALALCREILAQLGIRFPYVAVSLHVVAGILKIKSTLKKTTTPELVAKLPIMTDETRLWLMTLVDRFVTYAYLVKSDLLPLAIFKGLNMTMKDGVSYISPGMFALVGLSLAAFVHDYKGGVAFADQALELLKKVKGARKVESRVTFVTHAFVIHWLRPLSLSIKPLLASYDAGMSMGDTENASWSIYFCLEYSFRTGAPLETVAADCAFYAAHLKEVKQMKILAVLLNLWQTVLHLTGENPFHGTLTGDIVQQEVALLEATKDFEHLFAAIYRMQMYLAFVFDHHKLVYASICKTGADRGYYEKIFPGIAGLYHLKAFNGLSMISLHRETKEKKYLKLAKKFAANIKSLARVGNPNVSHYDALLNAELDSLKGDKYSAAQLYEVAVLYAGRRGLLQDHALAHERFGEHLMRLGGDQNAQDAQFHLREASKLYEEWGALAKVEQIRNKYPRLMAPPTEINVELSVDS